MAGKKASKSIPDWPTAGGYKLRIHWDDTDCTKRVYLGKYIKWIDDACTEYLRERGLVFDPDGWLKEDGRYIPAIVSRKAQALGPLASHTPMWLTSKRPAACRVALCSSMTLLYHTGISQPANGTIRAPNFLCVSLSVVFWIGAL